MQFEFILLNFIHSLQIHSYTLIFLYNMKFQKSKQTANKVAKISKNAPVKKFEIVKPFKKTEFFFEKIKLKIFYFSFCVFKAV